MIVRFGGVVIGALLLSWGAWASSTGSAANASTIPSNPSAWPLDAPTDEPVQLIVSVPEQRIRVYLGDELVADSPVSTGRQSHATPTGVFSILQKKKFHRSNIYSRAPMPFMQRLTWSGIALHGSNDVPNYPASHGCVRLPPEFAKKLFGLTKMGAHVIVSDGEAPTPSEISHPHLFQLMPVAANASLRPSLPASGEAREIVGEPSFVASSPQGEPTELVTPVEAVATRDPSPVRILVTRRTGRELVRDVQNLLNDLGFDPGETDGWMGRETGAAIARFQEANDLPATGTMSEDLVDELYRAAGLAERPPGHIYVRQNFEPVFDAPIGIAEPEKPLGAHLLTALDFEGNAPRVRWLATTLDGGVAASAGALAQDPLDRVRSALDRIEIPASIRLRIGKMLTPGSSMAITDDGISNETVAKGTDFVVLTRTAGTSR